MTNTTNDLYRASSYITRSVWYSIPQDIRRAILRVLPLTQKEIVSTAMFISNIENELRVRGEHELANRLIEAGKTEGENQ